MRWTALVVALVGCTALNLFDGEPFREVVCSEDSVCVAQLPDAGECAQAYCNADRVCAYKVRDGDGDGFGDAACATESPSLDGTADDCDDTEAASNPSAEETCNGVDADCDGMVDEEPASMMCVLMDATAACVSGACAIVECAPDFDDCDGAPENGCEADLTSPETCRRCDNRCAVPGARCNADATCTPTAQWITTVPLQDPSHVAVHGVEMTRDGEVYVLATLDGTLDINGTVLRSSFELEESVVFLWALDSLGETRWVRELGTTQEPVNADGNEGLIPLAALSLSGDALVVARDGEQLMPGPSTRVDRVSRTGELLWSTAVEHSEMLDRNRSISADELNVYVQASGTLGALQVATGELAWSREIQPFSSLRRSLAAIDGQVRTYGQCQGDVTVDGVSAGLAFARNYACLFGFDADGSLLRAVRLAEDRSTSTVRIAYGLAHDSAGNTIVVVDGEPMLVGGPLPNGFHAVLLDEDWIPTSSFFLGMVGPAFPGETRVEAGMLWQTGLDFLFAHPIEVVSAGGMAEPTVRLAADMEVVDRVSSVAASGTGFVVATPANHRQIGSKIDYGTGEILLPQDGSLLMVGRFER